jgi:hypothetical protein
VSAATPVLHYNPGQGDRVGGNFWDMRATGRRLGNPAAEQAEGPPTNPVEMGLPDIACAVYRASQRPYRALLERKWGAQAFAIGWPGDVEQVCNQPGPPPANDPMPVHLTELDRGRSAATFDQMAQSIVGYEASTEVTQVSLTREQKHRMALSSNLTATNKCALSARMATSEASQIGLMRSWRFRGDAGKCGAQIALVQSAGKYDAWRRSGSSWPLPSDARPPLPLGARGFAGRRSEGALARLSREGTLSEQSLGLRGPNTCRKYT